MESRTRLAFFASLSLTPSLRRALAWDRREALDPAFARSPTDRRYLSV